MLNFEIPRRLFLRALLNFNFQHVPLLPRFYSVATEVSLKNGLLEYDDSAPLIKARKQRDVLKIKVEELKESISIKEEDRELYTVGSLHCQ
jgi:hypothetical protein